MTQAESVRTLSWDYFFGSYIVIKLVDVSLDAANSHVPSNLEKTKRRKLMYRERLRYPNSSLFLVLVDFQARNFNNSIL